MKIEATWLGHSTWMITQGVHRVLIDPFVNDNPSCHVRDTDLNPTHICISHGHFDHIADAASIANRVGCPVYANYEIATWLSTLHGVQHAVGMNIGGKVKTDFGSLQLTPAIHSSGLPDGSYGGVAGGLFLAFQRDDWSHHLYYLGDTALFSDLKLMQRHRIDSVIVPIGDHFTMGPEDSLLAVEWVGAKYAFPTHYNTWPPIAQDPHRWANLVKQSTSAKPFVPLVDTPVIIE
jgi:L-ascorbate metabolism protein UlaG (beta-lactamase superfamily)